MKKTKMLYGTCTLCGNTNSFDKESLKASTIQVNGQPVIMCCYCEDDTLIKLAKRRLIDIKLRDGGNLLKVDVKDKTVNQDNNGVPITLKINVYYGNDEKGKIIIDTGEMRNEFEGQLAMLLKLVKNKTIKD